MELTVKEKVKKTSNVVDDTTTNTNLDTTDDTAIIDDNTSTDNADTAPEELVNPDDTIADVDDQDAHDIDVECNAAVMPALVNLLIILKHHCDNNLTASVTIANCQCGNNDLHDKKGGHTLIIGGETTDGDSIDDIIIDDTDYEEWIDTENQGNVNLVTVTKPSE